MRYAQATPTRWQRLRGSGLGGRGDGGMGRWGDGGMGKTLGSCDGDMASRVFLFEKRRSSIIADGGGYGAEIKATAVHTGKSGK
ncbi:hypothetical protein [[Phormidium] sp. ETS-05]|uniref:hypothetical protein n=1 Tax=[Phormidium] sp. ETS-05 TaxID=222819 RepID=UPI0018EF1F16|nr:hypothetical protein [[Phormidium] sp. ETS-05]